MCHAVSEVTEEAALQISGEEDAAAFEDAWAKQDIRFSIANVKLIRFALDDGQVGFTIGKISQYSFDSALGDNSLTLLCAPLPKGICPIIPCRVCDIVHIAHQGLGAKYSSEDKNVFRFGGLVHCLVVGTGRSSVQMFGSGKTISSRARDLLESEDAATFTIQTFAPEKRQTDFVLDKRTAVICVTALMKDNDVTTYVVDNLYIVEPWAVPATKAAMEKLIKVSMSAASNSVGKKRDALSLSPDSLQKARKLQSWPSDPMRS